MWCSVLTVVGELHSLTDWHVSEASEDAELDDFCSTNTQRDEHTTKMFIEQNQSERRASRLMCVRDVPGW